MEGLLFPIVMLTVTLVGGGIFLLVLKHQKPKHQSSEESACNPHGTGIYQCPGCKGQVSLH